MEFVSFCHIHLLFRRHRGRDGPGGVDGGLRCVDPVSYTHLLDTRCSIRFLDDIFQFGYALRYSHHDHTVPRQYVGLLDEYLSLIHI